MEIPSTLLVIAGFIIVLLGIGAGMLLSSLNEEGEPEGEGAEEAPPGGAKGRYTAVARLWRERGARGLVVEMDGKAYLGPDALEPAQRERLEAAARDLRAWLGMGLPAAELAPNAPIVPPSPGYTDSITTGAANALPQSVSRPPVSEAVPAGGVEVGAPAPAASIVTQIDDILQDLLAGSPLEGRGVRLIEDPARGVIVKVGYETYPGIDAVPDAEVKAAIRRAVAAWEKTQ